MSCLKSALRRFIPVLTEQLIALPEGLDEDERAGKRIGFDLFPQAGIPDLRDFDIEQITGMP